MIRAYMYQYLPTNKISFFLKVVAIDLNLQMWKYLKDSLLQIQFFQNNEIKRKTIQKECIDNMYTQLTFF
jgi:hypothetical protein